MITTVIFDLDDTLHDDTGAFRRATDEVCASAAHLYGITPASLGEAFLREVSNFWDTNDPAALGTVRPRTVMWTRALERFNISAGTAADTLTDEFERIRCGHYALYPQTVEVLEQLRQRGYKLGLLTNGLRDTHHLKIQLLGLGPFFDAVLLSDDIGIAKPHAAAFHLACRKLECAPSEAVMVGDRYDKDVAGALDAGLWAIWLNAQNEQAPNDRLPHAVIRSIEQVVSAVKALTRHSEKKPI